MLQCYETCQLGDHCFMSKLKYDVNMSTGYTLAYKRPIMQLPVSQKMEQNAVFPSDIASYALSLLSTLMVLLSAKVATHCCADQRM